MCDTKDNWIHLARQFQNEDTIDFYNFLCRLSEFEIKPFELEEVVELIHNRTHDEKIESLAKMELLKYL